MHWMQNLSGSCRRLWTGPVLGAPCWSLPTGSVLFVQPTPSSSWPMAKSVRSVGLGMGSGSGGTAKLYEHLACFQALEVMCWEQNPNRPRSSYPWINPGYYPLGKLNYRLPGPEDVYVVGKETEA